MLESAFAVVFILLCISLFFNLYLWEQSNLEKTLGDCYKLILDKYIK